MNLWYKSIASTFLIWLIFLTPIGIIFYRFAPLSYLCGLIIFSLVCWLALLLVLKKLYTDRLRYLNRELNREKPKALLIPGKMSAKDEITNIVVSINTIIAQLLNFEEKLTHRWRERDKTVSIANHGLHVNKDRLAQLAHYDPLTELPNRIFFNEMLNKSISHAHRQHTKLAILFVDLDHFKIVNETFGYKCGNKILKEVAARFTAVLRSGDIIARLGGDEFVILLNDIGMPKLASSIAEKLFQTLTTPFHIDNQTISITASIGICIFPEDGDSLEDLQKNTDIALFKAKNAGGGIYQYFTNEMTLEANKHIRLDKALRKAVINQEFILHFQPQLNLKTGFITGVEALIRWVHPELGLMNPTDFIPQAEQSGLIAQIGAWVLKEACMASRNWQKQGFDPVSIAVNLSPQQFSHPNLVKMIKNTLEETQLDPSLLELEITETSIIENVILTAEKLQAIKSLGIKICIDDFGTGYTSISFLKKFPIDILKIDQSFVKGIPESQNDTAITSAIIALAHNLGMQAVAEGVETIEQLDYLTRNHCDLIQGYYFSRPLSETKLLGQLRKREE